MNESPEAFGFFYNDTQNVVLSWLPHFVGPISMLGSALIIFVILRDRRQLLGANSYDRIMLGLSTCDALSSFGLTFFGPWAIPEQVEFVVGARASSFLPCEVAGSFLTMTIGTVLYTAGLMIYFILLVRLDWRPETIAKRVEPWIHASVFVFLSMIFSVALWKNYFNPLQIFPGVCWFQDYPPSCDVDGSEITCIRGKGSTLFAKIMGVLPFGSFVVTFVAMVLLTQQVWRLEQRLATYLVNSEQAPCYRRTRRMGQRALAYIGAFVITFLPLASFALITVEGREGKRTRRFRSSFCVLLFFPLQGFFNAIIYVYPKWNELTKRGGSLERLAQGLRIGRHCLVAICSFSKQLASGGRGGVNSGGDGTTIDDPTTSSASRTTVVPENENEQQQQQQDKPPPPRNADENDCFRGSAKNVFEGGGCVATLTTMSQPKPEISSSTTTPLQPQHQELSSNAVTFARIPHNKNHHVQDKSTTTSCCNLEQKDSAVFFHEEGGCDINDTPTK